MGQIAAGLLSNIYQEIPNEVIRPPLALSVKSTTDLSARLATREETSTPVDSVVIIQVSRMEPWKGHRLHLEALRRLKDLPGWTCWLVGGPQRPVEMQYLDDLKATAARYGIADRVCFLGQRQDVGRLLHAADVFCQPNVGPEPFGQVFVEALSAGLPIVTTAIGGGLEIVDSSCGLLTRPNDPVALADALRRFVTDSVFRSRLSDAAPARAKELCEPFRQLQRLAEAIDKTVRRGRIA